MEQITSFLSLLGEEVEDAEEEAFYLFAQDIPSSNLGFVDSRATTVDLTIQNQDYSIHQSPTLLSSSRAGGTTGAVLWKITPLFSEWLSSPTNPLWTQSLLSASSTIVELGCGISGLNALTLAPRVHHYIATDQDYVYRLFRQNIETNYHPSTSAKSSKRQQQSQQPKRKPKQQQQQPPTTTTTSSPNITFTSLDWELDVAGSLKASVGLEAAPLDGNDDDEEEEEADRGFDLLVSCDCIYNEALVAPFVRTCADICRLRPVYAADGHDGRRRRRPTICLIAQQQRSPEVFEAWLQETLRVFRVWRVSDEVLGPQLKSGTGYLVHLLLLR
ncbi:S-adenosylmethionine-dependent methyltransferase [Aspergillus saccharolyticus JOP 1030-1]|uniref:Diaminohydroxyphosphoribosylamino-pyrimidine deaminase n=1 Tax=Aspergillus saccharolyticus JOP 1030-1 TaxID=1450539 RepID=A0A318ZTB0_9EURO|nr:hypothetical protein BP01DRAFT_219828 [Aspergillus saccharolyticus JOP 1030-1]PYH47603.1 hypothetical protein BP01DRAFT_219828 [Aspergillus saccharolyticus JOP 1030-1]